MAGLGLAVGVANLSTATLVACGGGPSGGGTGDMVGETLETVFTLQSGTVGELRDRRGSGPFREYDVDPEEMLFVVEGAVGRARGAGDTPVSAVFVSKRYREVIAKERSPSDAGDDAYAPTWRSAVVVTVHPVTGRDDRSRVEIHAANKGPFHRGTISWERDLPGWIDAEMAGRAEPPTLKPLP